MRFSVDKERKHHMDKLIIVGAGGFGRELLQWCKDINKIKPTWAIQGFLDDDLDALAEYPCDYKVIGRISDWNPAPDERFVIAIADPQTKKRIVESMVSKGAEFVSVIHPTAMIGEFNQIGKGIVMYPYARITVNAVVGDYVTILDQTVIGHDAYIGNYTTMYGSVGINGHVQIGDCVVIGSHATTVPSVKVGNNSYVGAGGVVVSDIREGVKVVGVPAKRILPA